MNVLREYRVKPIVDGDCIGEVVVIDDWISFFGEVDPRRGVYVVDGKELSGKIMVFRGGRGSTVGSYVIYALKKYGKNPICMIVAEAEPIIIVGAVLANIPLLVVENYYDLLSCVKADGKVYYRRGSGVLRCYT